MDRNGEKKKSIRDNKYWENKLAKDKKYEEAEEQWKKDLLRLNPEVPKPYHR